MSETNRRSEIIQQLSDGIARLTTSEKWAEWLAVQSRFHRYSFNNTLLIQMQRPDATQVAGFHAWRKLGRNVRKGEKGIWILAPMTYKVTDGDDQESGTEARVLRGFKPVPVFDVSQTDGEDLPEVCTKLDGDDPAGVYAALVQVAASIGFTVEDADFTDSRNGDCTHELHRIRVQADNSAAQRIKTLAHELGHAILHGGPDRPDDRALLELEAESVAYVVTSSLGIASDDYSFAYVAVWSGGDDQAVAAIKGSGGRIQHAADTILGRLEAGDESTAAA